VSQIKYNTKSKIHQVKEKIIKLLEAVQVPRRNDKYFLVPLRGKVPVKNFPLQRLFDGEFYDDYDEIEEITGYGLATGLHWLVVIDFDDEEAFEKFKQVCPPELLITLIVRTRRGYHVYFVIKDKDVRNEQSKKFKNVDVKTGRSYVVLPFSVVEEFQYVVVQYRAVKRISYVEYKSLLDLLESEFNKEETEEVELEELEELEEEGRIESAEEKELVEKIVEVVLPFYVAGQRQQLLMSLSGYLIKKNVSHDVIENVIKELHARSNDEDPIKQRLSAFYNSLKKPSQSLAGASLLRELLTEQALKELDRLTTVTIKDGEGLFVVNERDSHWEEIKLKGKAKKVCTLFNLLRINYAEQTLNYVVYNPLTDEVVELGADNKEWRKAGIFIFSAQSFERLLAQLTKQAKIVKTQSFLGWDSKRKVFYHPALQPDLEFSIPAPFEEEDFIINHDTKEEHHRLILAALQEAKLLGVKYVLALASLFSSFTVIDIAPRGTGKTLTSRLASQLLCRYSNPLSLAATDTALELLFSTFRNFPILIDEAALTTDEKTQKLVFQLHARIGKLRGTKTLKVNAKRVEGVAFITSEREIDFTRFGVERRIITIKASSFEDYTKLFKPNDKVINEFLKLYGAGIDFIEFYLKHREKIDNAESTFSVAVMNDIPEAISKSFNLLLLFYQAMGYTGNFEKLAEKLSEVVTEQGGKAERDVYEIFVERLKEELIRNDEFFTEKAKYKYGNKVEEGTKVKYYVLTHVFDEFCKKNNFHKEYVLQKAKENKILETSDYNRFVKQCRINKIKVYCYCFVFEEEVKEEEKEIPF